MYVLLVYTTLHATYPDTTLVVHAMYGIYRISWYAGYEVQDVCCIRYRIHTYLRMLYMVFLVVH